MIPACIDGAPAQFAIGLAEELRNANIEPGLSRIESMIEALSLFPSPSTAELYWIGRAALCSNRDQFSIYDDCFSNLLSLPVQSVKAANEVEQTTADSRAPPIVRGSPSSVPDPNKLAAETEGVAGANDADLRCYRDIAVLNAEERAELFELVDRLNESVTFRRSRRYRRSWAGRIDVRRTIRDALEHGGDPGKLFPARLDRRERRCILLIDVSGSMSAYSELLLRFAYAIVNAHPRTTEIFTVGTQLSRLTRMLAAHDPNAALEQATSAILDWRGGTRLGDQLERFLDQWGQRGMARGASVIIVSDGWEQGDCVLLTEQMQRLRRLAYRTVWCNPHKSSAGFAPVARGMKAVLPYIDELVGCASFGELEALGLSIAAHR